MKKFLLFSLLIAVVPTASSSYAQVSDAAPIARLVTQCQQAVVTGELQAWMAFKPANEPDTLRFAIQLEFFKNQYGRDSLSAFVLRVDGQLWNAYDGATFYTVDPARRRVTVADTRDHGVGRLLAGNLIRTRVVLPFIRTFVPILRADDLHRAELALLERSDYTALALTLRDTFRNDIRIFDDDPEQARRTITYEIALPDFSLRARREWAEFSRSPQFSEIRYAPLRARPGRSFEEAFGGDSLRRQGFVFEEVFPFAPPDESDDALREGQACPDFALRRLDGQAVRLHEQRGKLVLLDFWYRGCPPCIQAMPGLESLHRRFGGQGLTVLGINPVDRDSSVVQAFLKDKNITYANLQVDRAVLEAALPIRRFPTMLLIDPATWQIRLALYGYAAETENFLATTLEKLLRE